MYNKCLGFDLDLLRLLRLPQLLLLLALLRLELVKLGWGFDFYIILGDWEERTGL